MIVASLVSALSATLLMACAFDTSGVAELMPDANGLQEFDAGAAADAARIYDAGHDSGSVDADAGWPDIAGEYDVASVGMPSVCMYWPYLGIEMPDATGAAWVTWVEGGVPSSRVHIVDAVTIQFDAHDAGDRHDQPWDAMVEDGVITGQVTTNYDLSPGCMPWGCVCTYNVTATPR